MINVKPMMFQNANQLVVRDNVIKNMVKCILGVAVYYGKRTLPVESKIFWHPRLLYHSNNTVGVLPTKGELYVN